MATKSEPKEEPKSEPKAEQHAEQHKPASRKDIKAPSALGFIEALKAAKEGKRIAPTKDGVAVGPHLFYDKSDFRWHYTDGVGLVMLPSPDELMGDWEAVD